MGPSDSDETRERRGGKDASEDPGMDWGEFATFMTELGVEDPNIIERHWDVMNSAGRVRPSRCSHPLEVWRS